MRETPRQSSPVKRIFGFLWWLSIMTLACGVGIVGNVVSRSSFLTALVTDPTAILNADPKEVFRDDSLTLLILGTDETRVITGWAREKDGTEHAISKPTGKSRADMILVARLDFVNNRITGLSIPRDTLCRLPGRRWREIRRINGYYSAAAEGEEKASMQMAVEHILPGVKIDRTIAINYEAFQNLVDTVGGVPVLVPKGKDGKGLVYHDWSGDLHIDLRPGLQTLSGKDAMGFVRFRHDAESDYGRQDRQKEFLASFKSSVLRHPLQLGNVAEQGKAVLDNVLSDKEIIGLIAFSRRVPPSSIKLGMLPTRETTRNGPLRVVESKRDDALREFGLLSSDDRTAAVER